MYVVAVSRTGHATAYGPFEHSAAAATWAEEFMPGWSRLVSGDPRGTYQFMHDPVEPQK